MHERGLRAYGVPGDELPVPGVFRAAEVDDGELLGRKGGRRLHAQQGRHTATRRAYVEVGVWGSRYCFWGVVRWNWRVTSNAWGWGEGGISERLYFRIDECVKHSLKTGTFFYWSCCRCMVSLILNYNRCLCLMIHIIFSGFLVVCLKWSLLLITSSFVIVRFTRYIAVMHESLFACI